MIKINHNAAVFGSIVLLLILIGGDMFMFFMGVGITLGTQYVIRRFGSNLGTAWKRVEKTFDDHLKG
jgi:hypothetical protein